MTQREKLIELLRQKPFGYSELSAGKLADHLLANGVIVPKVSLGDVVWYDVFNDVVSAVVYDMQIKAVGRGFLITNAYAKGASGKLSFDEGAVGKCVFLTREEAEAALKERERG